MGRPPAKLAEYRRKRDFDRTAEPSGSDKPDTIATRGAKSASSRLLCFVIQKHAASHLHFDLRLELGGVMKSWAIPKGPSIDPGVKRLAMEVEDHPIDYNTFEGTIPKGQYGGGTVMLWDRGTYAAAADPVSGDAESALRREYHAGRMDVVFSGERLHGAWTLVLTRGRGGDKPQWLFIKRTDEHARPGADIVADHMTSVESARTMEEITAGRRVWKSNRSATGAPSPAPSTRSSLKPVSAAKAISATAMSTKPVRKRATTSARSKVLKTGQASGSKSVASVVTESKAKGASRRTSESGEKKASPSGSRSKAASGSLSPMLASVGTAVPEGTNWAFEPKYDGIRVLAFATADAASLVTRNGNDKSVQFPEVVNAVRRLAKQAKRPVVLDGEIVPMVDGEPGRFQGLQGRMHSTDSSLIASHASSAPAALVAFDLLLDGDDLLMAEPWTERRRRLERLVARRTTASLLLGETFLGDGDALIRRANAEGWEGVIAKRSDSLYQPGARSPHWRKLKIEHRQEFVVGGWTEPRNSRQHLGAVLLGYFDGDKFVYVGHTGGGFDGTTLRQMSKLLGRLEIAASPFSTPVRTNERAHWAKPSVVVEVKFIEWTADGRLRQPIFLGVRDDKRARDVGREGASVQSGSGKKRSLTTAPRAQPAVRAGNHSALLTSLSDLEESRQNGSIALPGGTSLDLTNLGKVFYPDDGITKGDLLRYYARMAKYVLPVIADRPLILRRFPNGIEGKAFYQHSVADAPAGVRTEPVDVNGDGKSSPYLIGGDLATLLYIVQLGGVSIDPFHARVDQFDTADYSIVDLDPGPKATFARVVQVARWVKQELDRLRLHAAIKTSGSTGIHIYIPLPTGTVADVATIIAQIIATNVSTAHPKESTIERSVKARAPSAVYVDYLQNIPGKTVAGAYSVRARPGATVSTPLTWEELDDSDLDPGMFTIGTVPDRVTELGDLWSAAIKKKNTVRALRDIGGRS